MRVPVILLGLLAAAAGASAQTFELGGRLGAGCVGSENRTQQFFVSTGYRF